VSAEFREQLGAEHDIAVLASLDALDVYDHALGIDVVDFQVGEFSAAVSSRWLRAVIMDVVMHPEFENNKLKPPPRRLCRSFHRCG